MPEETNAIENESPRSREKAVLAHVVPFLGWIFLLGLLTPASGTFYAIRAAAGLGLLIYFKPWQYYEPLRVKHLPLAIGVGIGVFVLWVLPELFGGGWHTFYHTVGMMPPWSEKTFEPGSPYAPEVCGWALTLVRLAGSAFVIAIIEEFFWRGFVYRWMISANFRTADLSLFRPAMFFLVALLFGLEHTRWLAGFAAGLAYGWLVLRTEDLWAACIAHVVTNLLLGIYVLAVGAYHFW